jgi:DNA-directed RNA polymerase subunit RPC12/RpoP
MEGYCVRCKKKVELHEPHRVTMKNNRLGMQGTCPHCGMTLYRILGRIPAPLATARPRFAVQ